MPLETIEIETSAAPDAAIIWLHGLGADGNAIVATSIWSFAAEGSALTRWGSARSPRTTTTQSETRNSMARIILAGIAVYLARGVLSISVITPAAAIATP